MLHGPVVPFYVIGSVLAVWALIVTALGIRRGDSFPGRLEPVVAIVSITLVAATLTAAIVGAILVEAEENDEHAAAAASTL